MKTKEYIRPMPATWWLHNYHLTLFMIRELTSVFVAGYVVFLVVLVFLFEEGRQMSQQGSPVALNRVHEMLRHPLSITLQLIALVFIIPLGVAVVEVWREMNALLHWFSGI